MRVAYDWGPLLDPPTGVGRYAQELAAALETRDVALTKYAVSLRGSNEPSIARWRVPARFAQAWWRHFRSPTIGALVGDVDVVHATNFVLPSLGDVPGVVTIHDLSFFRDDVFPGGKRLETLVPWSIERATVVATPTDSIAREVQKAYGVPDSKIVITPEGVSGVFFGATPLADATLARMGIRRPFVLAVGSIEPRKNLKRLTDAWDVIARSHPDWTLVIAGPKGWGPQLPKRPGVVLTGWLSDETLPGLFAAAEVFCYPSLYEGFGLPPLEAMAAGTAALVGDYPAAEEVLGDSCVRVEPTDVRAIESGLLELIEDDRLRAITAAAGRARAVGFSWDACAAETISMYLRASRGS
ncbi:MAG: glycosyltransferase family 4 protein [Actinomycetota bacterium]|nr:glycosyltransferase family 4 protein [Actinomycetota bacterium]